MALIWILTATALMRLNEHKLEASIAKPNRLGEIGCGCVASSDLLRTSALFREGKRNLV